MKIRYNGIHTVKWLGDPRSRYYSVPLYLFGNDSGPTHLIGGDLDSAYDEYLDSLPPIENPNEAFDGENLKPGYEFQPNAGDGCGIVLISEYLWIAKYSQGRFKHLRKG